MIAIGRKYIAETETREGTEVIGDGFSRLLRRKKSGAQKTEKKKKKKKKGAESSLNRITQSSTQSGQETAQRSQNQGSLQEIGTQGGGGDKNTTEGKKRLGGQVFFFVSFFCFSLFLLSKIILFRFFFP